MNADIARQILLYALLFITFSICVWVGWSDHEFIKPEISQEEIREGIRYYIRRGIQVFIQFLIPLAILGYFGKKIFGHQDDS
ncbi:hypothetical protein [Microbulbifer sp. TYP-18]|uniref:hypothetical protein n=1 Tax=Microbulbifer sp. TYP-18 TaxID=3230024 RepID=UPI0034C6B786